MFVIIEVDSRYHHNLPTILEKDRRENFLHVLYGYIIIRLWDDEITLENVSRIIEVAKKEELPSLIRYFYPPEYVKRCPIDYLRKSKEIICVDLLKEYFGRQEDVD